MIEHITIVKIRNGWVLTILNKGIIQDVTEDIFLGSKNDIVKWIQDNL